MSDDSPFSPGRTVVCDDSTGFDLLSYALEQPFGAFVALKVLKSVSFVSETSVEVCCPFGNADIARLWAVVDVRGEGEGGGVGG